LRALGCAPGQIARVLLWEQGIVYGFGLLLGAILSVVCSLVLVPAFIFSPLVETGIGTATATAEDFYVAQSVPGVQVVTPLLPMLALLAGLVAICVLALLLMLRVVIRPQVSQTLRVDED
jgi:ABC-type lipoprotein release transport system permease subunit